MIARQLISRFRTNLRLFPTLAAITLIMGAAVFLFIAVVVGFASRSVWLGVAAAGSATAIDCLASFLLAVVVAQNPGAFAAAQRMADQVAGFFRASVVAEPGDEDEEGHDYDEEEDEEEEEQTSEQGVDDAVLAKLKERIGVSLLPNEIADETGFDVEDVKTSLASLQERGLVKQGDGEAYILSELSTEN
jgi:hypothetical protein